MVFRVLRLKQGIQLHYLASWTGRLSGLEALNPTCGYQHFFKISFYDVILLAEHEQNIKVSFLKQGSEMNGFCLKQGQSLKASAAHRHPNFP